MSALTVHRLLRRRRRQLAMLLAVCALGGIVGLAHSGLDGIHMPEMAAWCLAVVPLAAAVAVVAIGVVPLPRTTLPALTAGRRDRYVLHPPLPRARAGPIRLTVLRL